MGNEGIRDAREGTVREAMYGDENEKQVADQDGLSRNAEPGEGKEGRIRSQDESKKTRKGRQEELQNQRQRQTESLPEVQVAGPPSGGLPTRWQTTRESVLQLR